VDHTEDSFTATTSMGPQEQAAQPETIDLGQVSQGGDPAGTATGRTRRLFGTPVKLFITLAAVTITLYGMKYAEGVLSPILLALFMTMGASPVLNWLRRKGVPPWLAVTVVLLVFVVLGLLFVAITAASVSQLDDKLPVYKENLSNMMDNVTAWFSESGIDLSGLVSDAIAPNKIFDSVSGLLTSVLDTMRSLMLVIFVVLFMISAAYSDPHTLAERMKASGTFKSSLDNFGETTRSYLFTKTWLGVIVAVVVTIVYYIFGVDFAILWGLLFFILSFIPNIGFVLSVIPPFFVTLLEFGFRRALIVLMIVIVINALVDSGLSPRIMGRSVGLSSLVVFLSLVLWGWVLGPIGALISVPMTLMVKLLLFDSYEETRPLSEFMSAGIRARRHKGPR
jgi:predicted PurR-regulated permease PerM